MEKITEDRTSRGLNPSFKQTMVGALVFGKEDPDTGISEYKDAYGEAFSRERNLKVWADVGAAPLTRKCLESKKVRHNTAEAPLYVVHKSIEDANHLACELLTARGYSNMW